MTAIPNDFRCNRFIEKCILDICMKNNITCVPFSYNWVFLLSKKKAQKIISRHVYGYDLGLNPSSAHLIAKDKYASYTVLTNARIPAVKHILFVSSYYNTETIDSPLKSAVKNAESMIKNDARVVIKRNDGSSGRDVFLAKTKDEAMKCIYHLARNNRAIVLSPYIAITAEYRCVMLDDTCVMVFEKKRRSDEWRHNLAHGAVPSFEINESLKKILYFLASRACTSLGLRFCMVDIISSKNKISEYDIYHDELYYAILEVNSSVMLEHIARFGKEKEVKDIYEKAVLCLFE